MTLTILLIAIGAGVLSGLFGIGGGIVIVPALILLARFEPVAATGTSLAALVLPVGILGVVEYYRNGHLDIRVAAVLAVGLFVGAWFGARLAQELPAMVLRRLFAVFLLVAAMRLWLK